MKKFETPVIEVATFAVEDFITTSGLPVGPPPPLGSDIGDCIS